MANSNDLIKYITERVVTYIDTPKEVRKKGRGKEPWTVRWFGMIPFSLSLWKDDLASKRSRKRRT